MTAPVTDTLADSVALVAELREQVRVLTEESARRMALAIELEDDLVEVTAERDAALASKRAVGSVNAEAEPSAVISQRVRVAEVTSERDALQLRIDSARKHLSAAIDAQPGTSHYAHHDPKGTAGANCPACHASGTVSEELRSIAAALQPGVPR